MPKFISKLHNFTIFFDSLAEHFYRHKKQYITIGVLIISSVIVGVIAGFGYANNNSIDNIADITLRRYLNMHMSLGGVFASRVFGFITICIVIWLFSCNKWLSIINVFLLIYLGFVFGNTCAVIISLFRLGGFINILIVYLPSHLLKLIAFVAFMVVCQKYIFDHCGHKLGILTLDFYYYVKSVLFCTLILHFVACLLEVLLLPLFGGIMVVAVP